MACRIPIIAEAVSYLPGYNVRVVLVIQTPAQLREVYGPNGAETMLKTLAARIVFAPKDFPDAREISEELGYTTVILGVGPSMDVLVKEWKTLRDNDYKLRFRYPTQDEKKELRVINKELQSKGVSRRRRKTENQRTQLLEAIKRGEIDADQLISDVEKVRPTLSKQ